MTDPLQPGHDEPAGPAPDPDLAPLAAEPGAPVLDSFAAEEPTAPEDQPDDQRVADDQPAVADQPAPAAPPTAPPAAAPRGSEGLTTAPSRTQPAAPAPATEPPTLAEPPVPDELTPAEVPSDEQPAEAPSRPAVAAGDPSLSPADPSPPSTSTRGRSWLPLTAVGTAVALLAGATGWSAWQLRQQDRADAASVDAIAAARDAARLLFSYSHQTLQADFDKGLAVTTGDFRAQYQRTTKDVVSPVATQYKAVVRAEVVEAAVVDARADEVVALVFLNQATTSTRVQGQQVDQSRVRMRLVPRGGRWLVEEVKAL